MTSFELLPKDDTQRVQDAEPFEWPLWGGATDSVSSDVGAWLTSLGTVPGAAVDLVRIAAGAYMADRRSPRGVGFSRSINLHVQLTDPEPWRDGLSDVAELLFWLTGDDWALEVSGDGYYFPDPEPYDLPPVDAVSLLSGGLDSFCGAVLGGPTRRLYLGHWDNPTVKRAQNAAGRWLDQAFGESVEYRQIKVTQAAQKRETSSRSRSLLFLALATAAAAGRGATTVEVPENGYTSLNPPLGPERGGALSTRSTHPTTFARFNTLLAGLGINVVVRDPYSALTKGQLVRLAADVGLDDFVDGASMTLSCGKLDGRTYKGGNPNQHCGLCYPCIVRRGSFIAAGVDDGTAYLSELLKGEPLKKLRRNRFLDVTAVQRAVADGFDDLTLMSLGQYPDDFDIDQAVDLCETGLAELAGVPL